jgi:hypothetical protein
METATKLALLKLCAVLHNPAVDELGLASVAPLRAEVVERVGPPDRRDEAPATPRARRFWLESHLYDTAGELDRAGLVHLAALRNEMDPLVRPGESARAQVAARVEKAREQTTLL